MWEIAHGARKDGVWTDSIKSCRGFFFVFNLQNHAAPQQRQPRAGGALFAPAQRQ